MAQQSFPIESHRPFHQSALWQMNADYYHQQGVDAWRKGEVPHHLTSNSMVGRTYAELILGYLKDIAAQGNTVDIVYIIELGAGHGRLAYHILRHLDRLIELSTGALPPYCYVLTDIVTDNLNFFLNHPQLKEYIKNGKITVAYYDMTCTDHLHLHPHNIHIKTGDLNQSIIVLANYLFDSIPTDVFQVKAGKIYECEIALSSKMDATKLSLAIQLSQLNLDYKKTRVQQPHYAEDMYNRILDIYTDTLENSYVFFPNVSIDALQRLRTFSNRDMLLISLDKGKHDIRELDNHGPPNIVKHGSCSIWVNFHAIASACTLQGGIAHLPTFATNYLTCAALVYTTEPQNYPEVNSSYQRYVEAFGPDDFNTFKRLSYDTLESLSNKDLIALLRLSYYDSTIFIQYLPQLRRNAVDITYLERNRLVQTMDQVWENYFTLNETYDLAFEIAGFLYDLGDYESALVYYERSIHIYGFTAAVYYNQAMAYYQLKSDNLFLSTIDRGKNAFPDYKRFAELEELSLVE